MIKRFHSVGTEPYLWKEIVKRRGLSVCYHCLYDINEARIEYISIIEAADLLRHYPYKISPKEEQENGRSRVQ